MKICISTLTYLLLISTTVFAQWDLPKIDSLKKVLQTQKNDSSKVNTLNALADAYSNNIEVAKQYVNIAIELSKTINYKKGLSNAYMVLAYNYFYKNDYSATIKYASAALSITASLKDKRGMASAHSVLDAGYGMLGNRSENLRHAFAALRLWEEIGDSSYIAGCLGEIGNIYNSDGNYINSAKYSQLALIISRKIGDKSMIAYCLALLADVDVNNGKLGNALQKQQEALKTLSESDSVSFHYRARDHYSAIGTIYEKEGENALRSGNKIFAEKKFKGARESYLTALKYDNENNLESFASLDYNNLGGIEIKFNNLLVARDYFEKALNAAKSTGFKIGIRDSYYRLSALDSAEGNFLEGYKNYKNYITFRDSISNEESTRKSVQSQMQYEFDKKQAIAKAEQAKKDSEVKRIKNQQYFAIASLAIIVLAVVIIALIQFKNNKHKQKANTLLQGEKQKVESTLSELKSTQAQLIQSEKMASLGELTAGIAHEIQNPLNFVNNFSEVNTELIDELEEEANKGNIEEVRAIAWDIKENEHKINFHGKRADAIVKGMLQHSRSNAGQKEPTDINAIADEYLRLSYQGLRAKDKSFNADYKTDFDESIGKVNVVPQDIGRVLLNLYNNAFYAVSERQKAEGESYKPEVSVQTKKLSDKIEIKVADNGNGIPLHVADKIFQPFFTTKPTGQGTGLGLSLSYDIIKAHGGEIKVETKEGEGSAFIIALSLKQ